MERVDWSLKQHLPPLYAVHTTPHLDVRLQYGGAEGQHVVSLPKRPPGLATAKEVQALHLEGCVERYV